MMFGLTPLATRLIGGIAALLAAVAFIAWGKHGYDLADKWQAHSALEASNHRQTKANYRAAQVAAAEKARADRIETERRYADLAKEADHANETAAVWRAAADRFADAGGLRNQGRTSAVDAAGNSGTASQDHAASIDNGPGAATVVLSRSDFDTLTGNTDRLLRAHGWGERLIAEGYAVAQE